MSFFHPSITTKKYQPLIIKCQNVRLSEDQSFYFKFIQEREDTQVPQVPRLFTKASYAFGGGD